MSGGGVMLSGWLRKSPPEKKIKRHHSWKKRWFVLKSGRLSGDPNVLEYYKHQASRKPIKSINLNDCIQIDVNVTVKPDKKETVQQFVFDIVTRARTFFLVADSVREMSSWVHCLCDLCGFNHDSNESNDLGTEKRTFKADSINRNVNGTATTTTSLLPGADDVDVPPPNPRPNNTLPALSKPVVSPGNGYDFPAEDSSCDESNANLPTAKGVDFLEHMNGFSRDVPLLSKPIEDPDSNGYLHLADCETNVPSNSGFLDVGKMDERRSSTDSVFTHEGASGDNPDDCVPSMVSPTDGMSVRSSQNSRFLQKVQNARLSSMPDCPPPPPPTNIPPMRCVPPEIDDDDEDNVVDARRKPLSRTCTGNQGMTGHLPPIDDCDLYKVPLNLQREHRVDEDGTPWSGNSCSSYGSDGRRSSGKMIFDGPDYINTSESKGSGQLSSQSMGTLSVSSVFPSPGPVGGLSGMGNRMLYDVPSPLSPIFPLNSSSPRGSSQIPKSLERSHMTPSSTLGFANQSSKLLSDPHKPSEDHWASTIPMLDVGAMTTPISQATSSSMYSSPNSLPLILNQSMYSSPRDVGFSKANEVWSSVNTESTYAVPPARPPKPAGPNFGPSVDMNVNSTSLAANKYAENMYDSPRTHSSSSSTGNKDAAQADHSTYDTVRQYSPLSPPHTTVVGSVYDEQKVSNKMFRFGGASHQRNAISATNSPLATPDMSRRVGKTPSFNNKVSPPMSQNKAVSGSAPSLYDVPQPLRQSPATPSQQEPRSSQSSSASAESSLTSSSARNSAADTSIYEVPRKLTDTTITALNLKDPLQKVDDIEHPNYERMDDQHCNDDNEFEDSNPYTLMAGATTLPALAAFSSPSRPMHTRPVDNFEPQGLPPPIHRDLKPGRRSLGSDGGSSQAGSDKRKNASRDSYESDEAISPPHTSIIHTLPIVNEPKPQQKFQNGYNSTTSPRLSGSRNNSLTSPQHTKVGSVDNFSNLLAVNPVPPQRPPKSSNSSLSPRSPPMSAPSSQLTKRPYTPTYGSHKSPQVSHDRHFVTTSPSLTQGVPERPPKPANMKIHSDVSGTQKFEDCSFSPPRRPPKSHDDVGFAPSRPPKPSTTPSSGDSMFSANSLHSGSFFPSGISYGASSIVPPPPAQESFERELKYIEIKDFPVQSGTPIHLQLDIGDRAALNDSVEYSQVDVDKTRALHIMKVERQNKRANLEAQLPAKGKDKVESKKLIRKMDK